MAVSCNPKLIIADEPTTALDMTIQAQILELMQGLSTELGTAMILITHNLGVVARYAKRVIVMYAGSIIEEGTARQIYYDSPPPLYAGPAAFGPRLDEVEGVKLEPIEGLPPNLIGLGDSCNFAPRCRYAMDQCLTETPMLEAVQEVTPPHHAACWRSEDLPTWSVHPRLQEDKCDRVEWDRKTLIEVRDVRMYFPVTTGIVFQRKVAEVKAVDSVSLAINKGEVLGLVGESGSGKTTLGRVILQLLRQTSETCSTTGSG